MYPEGEMRAFLNSVMAALVVMALFWGNCLSCPQVLLAAQKHRCCPHGRATPHGKSDPQECSTQGLRNFVKADPAPLAAPLPTEAPAELASFQQLAMPADPIGFVPPPFTPPDLLPLRI